MNENINFDDEEWDKLLHSACYIDDEEIRQPTPELIWDYRFKIYKEGETIWWENNTLMGKFDYTFGEFPEDWPSWLVTGLCSMLRGNPKELFEDNTHQSKLVLNYAND